MKNSLISEHARKMISAIVILIAVMTVFTAVVPSIAYADDTTKSSQSSDMFSGILNDDGTIKEGSAAAAGSNNSLAGFVARYKSIVSLITGIAAVTMLIFMVIQILKLGSAGDNESARRKAIGGILTTGIATALLGGISIVVAFFWNILSQT